MWFGIVFRVASITKDHKDDNDQDYLVGGGGAVLPGPLLGTLLSTVVTNHR